jgi:iron complex outermembrane receptor protein
MNKTFLSVRPFRKVIYFLAGVLIAGGFFSSLSAQTLTGAVLDHQTNEPLAGASVSFKDTRLTSGTVTDQDGCFTLPFPSFPVTVQVAFLGYKRQEIVLHEISDPLTVKLVENFNLLNEVVVTSRRQRETVLEVPIPVSVVSGVQADNAGAFNVNRLK